MKWFSLRRYSKPSRKGGTVVGLAAPFIAVSGSVGAGKSTLVRKLGEALGVPTFPEEVESNPFFGPQSENALQSELWFLNESIAACKQASGHRGGIVERLPAEHLEIFARYRAEEDWLDKEELSLLEATFAAWADIPRGPNLLIHLELGRDAALERVRQRSRSGEEKLDANYLAALEPLYRSFLQRWTSCPILRIYTEKLDFREENDFALVLSDVRARLRRHLGVKLADGASLPTRAYDGDAGLDLASAIDAELPPLGRKKVPTGVSMHIPEGHVGLIVPRSGYAAKHGITHLDGPGIIDAGYRDQVHFLLFNSDTNETFQIRRGDRLGQIVIVPFATLEPLRMDGLTPTVRENRGLGSST
jgi:dUTP pyrophosphatase